MAEMSIEDLEARAREALLYRQSEERAFAETWGLEPEAARRIALPVDLAVLLLAEDGAVALLRDCQEALLDLGACDDEGCQQPNCLHILPRLRTWQARYREALDRIARRVAEMEKQDGD